MSIPFGLIEVFLSKVEAFLLQVLVFLFFFYNRNRHIQLSGAPNENIVQNHLNIALLNVF